jgi:hypothetical protein
MKVSVKRSTFMIAVVVVVSGGVERERKRMLPLKEQHCFFSEKTSQQNVEQKFNFLLNSLTNEKLYSFHLFWEHFSKCTQFIKFFDFTRSGETNTLKQEKRK